MATQRADGTFKLDMAEVEKNFLEDLKAKGGKAKLREEMQALRVAIYTMIGGGFIGNFAVNQPGDFYIDSRVSKRPYKQRDIYQAVAVLAVYFKVLKYTHANVPRLPHFHNCGVF
jgi:hypothetical protein